MKKEAKQIGLGAAMLALFALWSYAVQKVDLQPIGPLGSVVGFGAVNGWFHALTGVHLWLYTATDWLGLVPVFVCLGFGLLGFTQLITRRSLLRVDRELIILGIYYVVVIFAYLFFEVYPVNYRPVLLDGRLEASYPSSTTLLVLCVMPTLAFRLKRGKRSRLVTVFSLGMVMGRLLSGVHWLTDIIGAVFLSVGLFLVYRAAVGYFGKAKE